MTKRMHRLGHPDIRIKYATGIPGFSIHAPYVLWDGREKVLFGPASWDECIARRHAMIQEREEAGRSTPIEGGGA